MATAKKIIKKTAPARKRVVKPTEATVMAEPTVTVDEDAKADQALFTADVVDLRDINVVGRFAIIVQLQQAGYVFDGYSQFDATEMITLYSIESVEAIGLQHRNKLISAIRSFSHVPTEANVTTVVATSVNAASLMSEPASASSKQLWVDGVLYTKSSV